MLIYNIKTALRHLLKFKSHSVIGLVGFSNETPIGKDVLYRTDKVLTVQGIIKDIPGNSSLQFDFIVPYFIEIDKQTSWTNNNDNCIFNS